MGMPVGDYLGSEGFSADLTQTDIELHFSLSELDRRAVGRHRRAMNRLGIALQIGYLRLTGVNRHSSLQFAPNAHCRQLTEFTAMALIQRASNSY